MTTGFCSLGAVIDLLDATYSGFDYPQNAQVVGLLGDGTSGGGNAVLQQGALPFRQATLTIVVEGADAELVHGYYESRELVDFTDHDGALREVRVLDFARTLRFGDVWEVSATLLEFTAPGS